MVETQSEFGLCGRNELVLLITPGRRLFSGPEANQQGLIRQRNRRSPIETECSEVRYRSNPAGCLFGSYPPAPGKIDKLAILSGEIAQRSFVGPANNRNHDAVLRFDCHSDVD